MTSTFHSFDKSPLGVFIKSPLNVRGITEKIVWGVIIRPLFGFPDHAVNDVGQMNKKQDDIKKIGINEGFNEDEVFSFQEFKGSLYCCGDFNFKDGGSLPRPFTSIAKYNPSNGKWEGLTALTFPTPSVLFDLSNFAQNMVVFEGLLIIQGGFNRAINNTNTTSNGLVGWDGSNFVSVGATLAFNPVNFINDVIVFNGLLTVCGLITNFDTFDNNPIKFRLNDVWTLASPAETNIGDATAMVVYKDELYFALDSGTIRKWSGEGTFATVATYTGEIRTMEVHNKKLTIGGTVSVVDGVSVRGVAEFNGTNWSEIGTGLNFAGSLEGAYQLLSAGLVLYVVGQFEGNNDGDDFMGLAKFPIGAADWKKTWDDADMDNNLTNGFSLGIFRGKLDFDPDA